MSRWLRSHWPNPLRSGPDTPPVMMVVMILTDRGERQNIIQCAGVYRALQGGSLSMASATSWRPGWSDLELPTFALLEDGPTDAESLDEAVAAAALDAGAQPGSLNGITAQPAHGHVVPPVLLNGRNAHKMNNNIYTSTGLVVPHCSSNTQVLVDLAHSGQEQCGQKTHSRAGPHPHALVT